MRVITKAVTVASAVMKVQYSDGTKCQLILKATADDVVIKRLRNPNGTQDLAWVFTNVATRPGSQELYTWIEERDGDEL